ncbi:helix-turn-helix transcriptional regulator [Micromonospora harpali]|uniref:DNA-binding protein n=2 Tax=Micromonospora TaxID=1873 RepID=A0A0D0X339_9ACTN|nr:MULTISPECIES: helix-turn-helix transcriptional regulator [Micromonospora]KIR65501.1 DNA-binding protein [Micromonospora haikouensis]MDI5939645.1 helix-turn-helix transcriptional regulator [Micromonospora sp. DH15]OON31700.1 transcriptional regulator [Micromonospora sp. Rc5]SCE64606.1 Helix-turn-helix domain-containing protein [Micromonospora haikouensis]
MAPKTARARRLGIALRTHREAAGLTLEAAADEINSTRSTLSRYENAQTLISPATVRALLTLYGVGADELAAAVQLAKDARKPGWWVSYSYLLDRRTIDFIALEAEATGIANFEPSVVPGLLQTADYIRGVMRGGPHTLSDEQVEQRVHLRLDRQQRITGDDPAILDAIIDEGALLRPVGGQAVMEAQLHHLLKMAELPNITVQVIPLSAGYHRGTRGSLHILEFPDPEDPHIASVETVAGQMVLDRPGDLRTCTKIMEHLRTVALSPAATRDQLLRLLKGR